MATLLILLISAGFYSFYLTSRRADYFPPRFIRPFATNRSYTKITGTAFFLLSSLLSIYIFGVGSGMLIFFIVLMTVGSLIVILAPLGIFSYRVLLSIIASLLALDLLI